MEHSWRSLCRSVSAFFGVVFRTVFQPLPGLFLSGGTFSSAWKTHRESAESLVRTSFVQFETFGVRALTSQGVFFSFARQKSIVTVCSNVIACVFVCNRRHGVGFAVVHRLFCFGVRKLARTSTIPQHDIAR